MNITAVTPNDPTKALFSVIRGGDDPREILSAIRNGFDIDTQSPDCGKTLLFKAAEHGRASIVRVLIKLEANLEITSSTFNNTPLHAAARKGHELCVSRLLKAGAKVAARTQTGQTPLHLAIEEGHNAIAANLIRCKAPIDSTNNKGLTPLHVAATKSNVEGVALLINNKCNIDARTPDDQTALNLATQIGNQDIIRLLKAARGEKG